VGDKLTEIPEDGSILRHFAQNNKIKATRDGTDTGIVLDNMKRIQAGVISFSETNANWKQKKYIKSMFISLRVPYSGFSCSPSNELQPRHPYHC
jgi:hypothetical protein